MLGRPLQYGSNQGSPIAFQGSEQVPVAFCRGVGAGVQAVALYSHAVVTGSEIEASNVLRFYSLVDSFKPMGDWVRISYVGSYCSIGSESASKQSKRKE
jgi:hypothetical protein